MLAGSSLSMLRSAHHSIISANVHTNLIHADQFSQEEMKAQRGGVTCPISHSHLTQPKMRGKTAWSLCGLPGSAWRQLLRDLSLCVPAL